MNSGLNNSTYYPEEIQDIVNLFNHTLYYVYPFPTLLFCILALVVLCYYVRRRYFLIRDIKGISKDQLIIPDFQNHLKNLKIKSMITIFLIIILTLEILYNFSSLILDIQYYIPKFLIFNPVLSCLFSIAAKFFNYLSIITCYSQIAVPCLLMKVLWIAYLHCPYKNTVKRWSVYIAVRCVVATILSFLETTNFPYYEIELGFLYTVVVDLFFTLDFGLYLLYARRFYKHLKSREIEAKLFKDEITYRNEKMLCLHFKVASILIIVAILFFVISMYLQSFNFLLSFFHLFNLNGDFYVYLNQILYTLDVFAGLFNIVCIILMSLNYLYFVTMLLVIYLRQKWRLNRVNRKIKPIVARYHETLHYRRC